MKKIFIAILAIVITLTLTACTKEETKYDYLVLVNKYSQLPSNWEENVELVDTKNAWDEDIKIEKKHLKNIKN